METNKRKSNNSDEIDQQIIDIKRMTPLNMSINLAGLALFALATRKEETKAKASFAKAKSSKKPQLRSK